ncbi:tail terminator [Arthrobacter phage Faja]|uniref:Tail terminator n=1 Tax=Arthrobacter phage Faja TaxID=2419957 RepID=A0A3G2KFX6_9CAUD|nr:tail terminator [Arthrobacter phage Faja]AYN57868.1 tail terminator [Arthrobacter phage Faja]
MSKAHYDAFEQLIPDGIRVFRGSAPIEPVSADYPYVVLGGNAGTESTEAVAGDPDSLDLRFKLTYAGLSLDSVLIIMGQVRPTIRAARMVVPGWVCGLFRHESLVDITTDFGVKVADVGANPVYAVDEYAVFCAR